MSDGRHRGRNSERQELRCFCTRAPLLAVYGADKNGRPFLHIKIYKQGRVFGEIVARGGEIELRCRECIRWHRIFIRDSRPVMVSVDEPIEIQNVNGANASLSNGSALT